MKKILLVLFIMGISFACQTLTVSEFINQSVELTDDCINIVDEVTGNTITINALSASVVRNDEISLQPNTSVIDPVSNNTYICQAQTLSPLNTNLIVGQSLISPERNVYVTCNAGSLSQITQTIEQGDTYTSLERNVSVSCQAVTCNTKANVNEILTCGETYYNEERNITVKAPACIKLNQVYELNYNQSYRNENLNLTVKAPVMPKLNIIQNLSSGQTYSNSQYNVSLKCQPNDCMQNIQQTLDVGGKFYNAACNITISGPKASTEVIQAEFGKEKKDSKYGVTCKGPPILNQVYNLTEGNDYFEKVDEGIKVYCTYNKSAIPPCWSSDLNVNALFKINNNQSSCLAATVCLDKFKYSCKPEELVNGDIYGCWNRLDNDRDTTLNRTKEELRITQDELSAWKDPKKASQDQMETFVQMIMIGFFAFLVIILAVFYVLVVRKNDSLKMPITPPKGERK